MDTANTDQSNGVFALRCNSATDKKHSQILLQTVGASPETPYEIDINLIFDEPFTDGEGVIGQFDLTERDAADEENEEILLATKDGFVDPPPGSLEGQPLIRTITVDKLYRINFIPGKTGDGTYSLSARGGLAPELPDPEEPEFPDPDFGMTNQADFVTPGQITMGALIAMGGFAAVGLVVATGLWVEGTLIETLEIALANPIWGGGVRYAGLTQAEVAFATFVEAAETDMAIEAAFAIEAPGMGGYGFALIEGMLSGMQGGGGSALGIGAIAAFGGFGPGFHETTSDYMDNYFDHNYGIIPDGNGWWYFDAGNAGQPGQWRYYRLD